MNPTLRDTNTSLAQLRFGPNGATATLVTTNLPGRAPLTAGTLEACFREAGREFVPNASTVASTRPFDPLLVRELVYLANKL